MYINSSEYHYIHPIEAQDDGTNGLLIYSSKDHYTHPIEAQDDGTNGLLIIPKPPKRH